MKRILKPILFVLLFTVFCLTAVNADYLVIKINSRGLHNGRLESDWRDGQIIAIFSDSEVESYPLSHNGAEFFSEHMKKNFLIIKVNRQYTEEERNRLLKMVFEYDAEGKPVKLKARRKYYVNIPKIVIMKNDPLGMKKLLKEKKDFTGEIKKHEDKIKKLYKKSQSNGIFDLMGFSVEDIIQNTDEVPIQTNA